MPMVAAVRAMTRYSASRDIMYSAPPGEEADEDAAAGPETEPTAADD